MKLRGYLPASLGGEMVYEDVVRTKHFSDNFLLQDYLEAQATKAYCREEMAHYKRIVGLIMQIPGYRDFDQVRESRLAPQHFTGVVGLSAPVNRR